MNLYYLHYSSSALKDLGVNLKINSQLDVFKKAGFEVHDISINRNDKDSFIRKSLRHILPLSIPEKLRGISGGIIYIRGSLVDANHFMLFKELKKNNNLIVFEIPTFPFKDECQGLRRIQYYLHLLWIKQVKKYIDFFVGISYYSKIYNKETISIENGINTNSYSLKRKQQFHKTINVVIIAHLYRYHGVDRFIEGLGEYYQLNDSEYKIYLHIVGDGKIVDELKQLINYHKIEKYCIFYGVKSGEDLNKIYDEMHIGLASLGLHRINIHVASVLKSREYFAKGLPFITSVDIPDIPKDFEYVKYFSADESAIDMHEVIKFTKKIYSEDDFDLKIRKWSEENLTWKNKMIPVIKKINDLMKPIRTESKI